MARTKEQSKHNKVEKRTSQGGNVPKTSSMSKHQKKSYKPYRGQGK